MAETLYKLVVMGDGGVGKTALTIQLCSHHFVEYYDRTYLRFRNNCYGRDVEVINSRHIATIESSYRRQVVIDNKPCMLEILDTAGQDDYTALRSSWIRSGEGFVIIYDITSRSSFDQVQTFRNQILQDKDKDWVPMILVGNKVDLEVNREVATMEGAELAKNWKAEFIETSAKSRKNVDEVFFSVVRQIRAQSENTNKKKKKTSVVTDKLKKKLDAASCTLI